MLLTIPQRHKPSFERLIGLPSEAMRALIDGLRKAAPATSLYELTSALSAAAPGMDFDTLYKLLSMLASLYRVRTDMGLSVREFVKELSAAAEAQAEPASRLQGRDWSILKKNLAEIFESDESLGLTAKVSELMAENERRFCPLNSRIVSDIRPVFLGDVHKKPSAAIVQHILKVAYHEGDDLKEFFVALDGSDVQQLQDLLERAVAKEESLRAVAKDAGLKVLSEPEGDDE